MGHCPRCGRDEVEMHPVDTHLCVDCVKAENVRMVHKRQHPENWMEVAKESGIDIWLQQPGETQWEYTIWTAYRDSYPGKRPSYGSVARQLDTTVAAVKHVAQRWSFPIRLQHWMKYCDDITMLQRRNEIINMNQEHISMAQKLRTKLDTAIDMINPAELKPTDIAALAKLATDMERKAEIDTAAQEEIRRDLLVDDENPEIKKVTTKQSDLGEVVNILMKSGALADIKAIGIKQELVIHGGGGDE